MAMRVARRHSPGTGACWRSRAAVFALFLASAPAVLAEEATVGIDNFTFAPATLAIKAGTTVIFRNDDDTPHLVVDSGGKFRSQALDTDDKFSVTFDKPGETDYFCGLHPHMHGKIIVTP